MTVELRPGCIGRNPERPLLDTASLDLMPCAGLQKDLTIPLLTEEEKKLYESSLDGVSALRIARPRSKAEEDRLVRSFLNGLRKLLSKENNWTFWQQLVLSLENCVRCQTCSEACPIYLASGRQEVYRPTFRSEVLRRIKGKYLDGGGKFRAWLSGNDIELNWATVARLAELAYRCTLCRRCAQVCPMGVDNGLISRELRKLFSQEMGIAPRELHELGTVRQLGGYSSSGGPSFHSMVVFIEAEIKERTGKAIKIPVDKVGADFLFIQTSMESPLWLKCPECFAIIFEKAGMNWTLSSDLGFGGTNFGVWYDDIQFARIVVQQIRVAQKLKVKGIVLGECGHAYKGLASLADRILIEEANIPRQSWLPLVEDIVRSGKLELDPRKNSFPVTLHDPCNIVRQMGVVEPQRQIIRSICPQFREMEPHGLDNYCCGGGSGFIIMSATNFPDWRASVAGRMKLRQILETFADLPRQTKKYVCAPCFTCKLQIRDLLSRYGIWQSHDIVSGGLVELIVNAMVDVREPFIQWDM